jgi:hypothetical protein
MLCMFQTMTWISLGHGVWTTTKRNTKTMFFLMDHWSGPDLRATSHTSQEPCHEIARAQKKVCKGRPKTPPKSCSVVTDPRVLYVTGPSTKCHFIEFLKYNKSTTVSIRSAMVSWFCVRPTSKRSVMKIMQVTMRHDPFDAM